MNPFEELCLLASKEKWCWNIICTTCGHMHFRYAFLELANGKSPVNTDWGVHQNTNLSNYNTEIPRTFTENQKNKILELCTSSDLNIIASNCNFPDWLGYLGLIIHHFVSHDELSIKLSRNWAHQLCQFVIKDSILYNKLVDLTNDQRKLITIDLLEEIELVINKSNQNNISFMK